MEHVPKAYAIICHDKVGGGGVSLAGWARVCSYESMLHATALM